MGWEGDGPGQEAGGSGNAYPELHPVALPTVDEVAERAGSPSLRESDTTPAVCYFPRKARRTFCRICPLVPMRASRCNSRPSAVRRSSTEGCVLTSREEGE